MNEVKASIITIGDELLIGQTIDTNSAFIAQEFNKVGIWVQRRLAIGDLYDDIWNALDEEAKHSQIIVITGGLGPTADDITKPLLCKYFGGKLILNQDVLKHVEHLFNNIFRRPGPLLERNIKQAEVPDNCIVLHNEFGTAPGMWFEKENAAGEKIVFISLPGVPHEMKGLIKKEVMPRLSYTFNFPVIIHKSIFTAGIGESAVAERLKDYEEKLPAHIKLAYLPSYGMVRLRLTGKGNDQTLLENEISGLHQQLVKQLEDVLVSNEGSPLEVVVGDILKQKGKTLATAESCTGGYIAHLITSVAGSSQYFMGSVVSYSNEVKKKILHVSQETLAQEGAVSEATVKQMVIGAIEQLGTDYAVATSGIMGPDGGTAEKPVGTVWIAAGNKNEVITKLLHFRFDRERNIQLAALNALNLLRKFMLST